MKPTLLAALLLLSGCAQPPKEQLLDYQSPVPATVAVPEKQRVATLFAALKTEIESAPGDSKMLADLQAEYTEKSNTGEGLRYFDGKMCTYRQYIEVPFGPNAPKIKELSRQLQQALDDQYKVTDQYITTHFKFGTY